MTTLLALLALAVGIAFLIGGAEALVRAAASLARRLGVSEFVVGVTVVAFGTSAPELFASVGAVLQGEPELAVGNVVGSNIANILLILGAGGALAPMLLSRRVRRVEIPLMAAITAVTVALMLDHAVGRVEGALLFLGLIAYVVFAVRSGAVDPTDELPPKGSVPKDLLLAALGIVALGVGTRAVVYGAVTVATGLGIDEGVVGLTVVAFGTSLPELAATVRAAFAKKSDIAVGNIIGSNVFNLLSVLAICAIVKPLPIDPGMMTHVVVMAAVTAALLAWGLARPVIGRWTGLVFIGAYLAYVILAYRP